MNIAFIGLFMLACTFLVFWIALKCLDKTPEFKEMLKDKFITKTLDIIYLGMQVFIMPTAYNSLYKIYNSWKYKDPMWWRWPEFGILAMILLFPLIIIRLIKISKMSRKWGKWLACIDEKPYWIDTDRKWMIYFTVSNYRYVVYQLIIVFLVLDPGEQVVFLVCLA